MGKSIPAQFRFVDLDEPLFGQARSKEYRRRLAIIAEHAPPPPGTRGGGS